MTSRSIRVFRILSCMVLLSMLAVACGGDDNATIAPTAESGVDGSGAVPTGAIDPAMSGSGQPTQGNQQASTGGEVAGSGAGDPATQPEPTEAIPTFLPNELGYIPILEYHHIGDTPEQFIRTPEQFRSDLQWLYDNGFYVVNLHDILDDTMAVPAGKRPVALTFDDSPASQFRLLPLANGQLAVDPNSAVGIMEQFFAAHPDFGRGGHFAVLPDRLFNWTPAEFEGDQTDYARLKLEWLINHGYELGNHTLDHANLGDISDAEVKEQLALANDAILAIEPRANIRVVTLPYGIYPNGGDDTLLRGFNYEKRTYVWDAALMVGANPTVSPISSQFDPYAIARIQAFDEELAKWFEVFLTEPDLMYVSDGDAMTVTVPNDLHPWVVGTLNEAKIGNRDLVRY